MKYYEVGFDAGVCYSCNIIQGKTEAACRYAAEQHAKRYGYTVGYFEEIAESALEYNRKPVWSADRYPEPTEPEQPKTETAEVDETEANEQEEIKMEIRRNEYADMPYIEFRKKFHRTLKRYPGMECAYNPHYAYEVTTTKYYKVGSKWHEKTEEKTIETVPGNYYMNMIDAIPFSVTSAARSACKWAIRSPGTFLHSFSAFRRTEKKRSCVNSSRFKSES